MDENVYTNDEFDDVLDFSKHDANLMRMLLDPNALTNPTLTYGIRNGPIFDVPNVDNHVVQCIENAREINDFFDANSVTTVDYSYESIIGDGFFDPPVQQDYQLNDGGLMCEPLRSPQWCFASSDVTPAQVNVPVPNTFRCEPIQSTGHSKPKQKAHRVLPMNTMEYIDRNYWRMFDENGKERKPVLHEFLRLLLANGNYAHIAQYIDKSRGIFRFFDRERAAQMWSLVKGRNTSTPMTYEKLARGIRTYYPTKVISRTPGRFTFRFDRGSGFGFTWIPA